MKTIEALDDWKAQGFKFAVILEESELIPSIESSLFDFARENSAAVKFEEGEMILVQTDPKDSESQTAFPNPGLYDRNRNSIRTIKI